MDKSYFPRKNLINICHEKFFYHHIERISCIFVWPSDDRCEPEVGGAGGDWLDETTGGV